MEYIIKTIKKNKYNKEIYSRDSESNANSNIYPGIDQASGKQVQPEGQTEELTKYANAQGWEIVEQFKDLDCGGKLDKIG